MVMVRTINLMPMFVKSVITVNMRHSPETAKQSARLWLKIGISVSVLGQKIHFDV